MSVPQLQLPGGGKVQPVTAGLVAAIVVASLAAIFSPEAFAWLGTPGSTVAGIEFAPQLWRPFTAGLLSPGLLSLILTAIFTYWCGASVENLLGAKRYLLTAASAALGAAVLSALALPTVLIPTATVLVWGLIGASTVIAYSLHADVRSQLIIFGLLLLISLQSGIGILVTLGGLLGGLVAGCIIAYLPHPKPNPDDWSRRTRTQGGRIDAALWAFVAALLLVWVVLMVLGT